jgi:Transposase DDE domain
VASGGEGSETFLQHFNGVYLLDSTEVPVPAEWENVWSGGGNQHRRRAALKVQTLWDYQGGRLHFSLHPARRHDAALPVASLPAGAIRITDSGYFDVAHLQALDEQDSFYLTRVPCKVRLFDGQGHKWHLSHFLRQHAAAHFDGAVILTAQGLRCRLLAQRVPDAVVAQRQARLRQTARRKRKPLSQEAMALAHWTIVVTNLPATRLTFDQAFLLLRLRWQIELLFKLWKQHTHLETSRSRQPHRIMCEIYAKLLGLVIQHALLLATCWDVPNQSLVKLAQTVRKSAFLLAFAVWTDSLHFHSILTALRFVLRSGCRLDTRKAQPSHFQRLLSLS